MRPFGLALGVCFVLRASVAFAAPPLDSGGSLPGRGTHPAHGLIAMPHPAPELNLDHPQPIPPGGRVGHYKIVVILLQFSDQPADTVHHTPAMYDSMLFSIGTYPTGSFRDYYREASRGLFDVSGIVTKWYTAPHPYSFYTNGTSGLGSPPNAATMAQDAVLLANADVDFSQFDNDGPDGIPNSGDDDGTVDGIFIVHAGPGAEETENASDIWSQEAAFPTTPVDGVSASVYMATPEEFGLNSAYSTAGNIMSIGVFCHEFGHVLGLPDLYDLTGASSGIGEWDVMGYGVYNHLAGQPYGSSPAHPSAWSKIRMGWVNPTWVFQDSSSVTIPSVESSGRVFRLWTDGDDAGQYFLVENRQPVGFDQGLVRSSVEGGLGPAHGLVIYHVDESQLNNNDPAHKMIDVEEAGGPETEFGYHGVQNLDLLKDTVEPENVCGATVSVTGNRGDRYDPWPGAGGATSFDPGSCPNTGSTCGNVPSQVAIRNIVESVGSIGADFFVKGIAVQRLALASDDSPMNGTPNNGNGLIEPGETVRLRFPIVNAGSATTSGLIARLRAEPYLTLSPDSVQYGTIAPGASDSGTVVLATVQANTPDPRGVNISFSVHGAPGLVDSDSVQVLVGAKIGICDDFEGTQRRWVSASEDCGLVNEWHREAGINNTTGGTWAWRLGPQGLVGTYAPTEDARLISQPVRLQGLADTLDFWQRYDTQPGDGLNVEISTDGAQTWTALQPVGGYSNGDRWSGAQHTTFTEAKCPLTGYSGIVQFAFRFRSTPPDEGQGWWIDDVSVMGTDACTPVSVLIAGFTAQPIAGHAAVQLAWRLSDAVGAQVTLERASIGEARHAIANVISEGSDGAYEDDGVASGRTYTYWLEAARAGEPSSVAGPVLVGIPAGVGSDGVPRVLAISRITPNPFSTAANFSVSLDRDGPFVVRVYRADGSLVRTLADTVGRSQPVPFTWDGTDGRGHQLAAGVYFFELRSGNRVRVQRAVLLK